MDSFIRFLKSGVQAICYNNPHRGSVFLELFIMVPESTPWMLMARSFIAIIVVQFVSFSHFFITFLCKLGEDAAVEQLH